MVTPNPLAILAELEAGGVRVALTAGKLRTSGHVPPDLAITLRRHRDLVIAVLAGRVTGHIWAPCTVCSLGTLTPVLDSRGKPRSTWPTCRMTPRCPGCHQPNPNELPRVAPVPPPTQATPPPRMERQRLFGERPQWPAKRVTNASDAALPLRETAQ